jgi:hypothetical protein
VPLLVGALLAFAVGLYATGVGLDRDRAFYPVVTMVIASYYALFAVMAASTHALVLESLVCAVFVGVAVTGFKWSLWVVVVALGAHGVFDLTHGAVISSPGVPGWWPEFCLTYDVTAAAYLAWLLASGRIRAAARALQPEEPIH